MIYSFEVENVEYNVDTRNISEVEVATNVLIMAINDEQNKINELKKKSDTKTSTIDEITKAQNKIETYKAYISDIIEKSGSEPEEE